VRVALATLLSLPLAARATPLPAQDAPQGPPPTPVKVLPVARERVEDRAFVTGDLRAERRSLVAAQEEGLVLEVHAREGVAVRGGDVLVRLDGERLERDRGALTALRAAMVAERAERNAELDRTRRDVASLETLSGRGVTNPKELEDARSDAAVAEARVARAIAALEELDARLALNTRRLADTTIRAPFDGIVVEKRIDVGEWIGAGDPAVELVSTGTVEAWLTVPESLRPAVVAAIRGGAAGEPSHEAHGGTNGGGGYSIEVRVDAIGRTFRGESPRLIPRIDEASRNFPLVVTIADPEGLLAPGMSASAHVPTGRSGEHLLVHKDAILRGTTGSFIYVAKALGPGAPPAAIPMNVTVLFPAGDRIAVAAPGLSPGDLAVVEGNERLFPMTPLAPQGPAGAEAPPSPGGSAAPEADDATAPESGAAGKGARR